MCIRDRIIVPPLEERVTLPVTASGERVMSSLVVDSVRAVSYTNLDVYKRQC